MHASVGVHAEPSRPALRREHDRGDPPRPSGSFSGRWRHWRRPRARSSRVVASSLTGLAVLADRRGDRASRGAPLPARARRFRRRRTGRITWTSRGRSSASPALARPQGDVQHAVTLLSRAHDIRERHLAHNLPLGSERQKLSFLKLFADDTDHALTLHAPVGAARPAGPSSRLHDVAAPQGPRARRDAGHPRRAAFTRQPGGSGSLRSTLQGSFAARRGHPARPGGNSRRQSTRRSSGNSTNRWTSSKPTSARGAQPSARSPRPITLDAVQAAIPSGTTLVEFARYRPTVDASESRPSRGTPHTCSRRRPGRTGLTSATPQRSMVPWTPGVRPCATRGGLMTRVSPVRWTPGSCSRCAAHLGRSSHLLIAPDGALNLIPFAALVDEESRYLVERYTITYLTSGRDLLRLQLPHESRSQPLIVAAPAFGEPALVRRTAATRHASGLFAGVLRAAARSRRRSARAQGPAAEATVLVGEQATEAALRRVSGPRILHIATHGFFLRSDEAASALLAASGRHSAG